MKIDPIFEMKNSSSYPSCSKLDACSISASKLKICSFMGFISIMSNYVIEATLPTIIEELAGVATLIICMCTII